jgi:hypothetical protein
MNPLPVKFSPIRQTRAWDYGRKDNSEKGRIYTAAGVVDVFCYLGGEHGDPFTRLDLFIWPFEFWLQLPRSYPRGWLGRIARQFARECQKLAKENA